MLFYYLLCSFLFCSFYREYIEQGGGTDKDWINSETIPNYIDTYSSSINELEIDRKRSDIALDELSAKDTFTWGCFFASITLCELP